MKKPKFIIDKYIMRKHPFGGFKILRYGHYDNEKVLRKKTMFKHLSLDEAENKLYLLEKGKTF